MLMLFYQWSEEPCAAHLTQRDGYHASTQGQLKDQLYQEIINYFDKGKVTITITTCFSQKKNCSNSLLQLMPKRTFGDVDVN